MKRNQLYKLLNQMNLNGQAVEIGVCEAKFAMNYIPKTYFKTYHLIDPYKHYPQDIYNDGQNKEQSIQDQRYIELTNKFKHFGDRINIVRKESLEAVNDYPNNYFDFIYIDANHSYEAVKADINAWYPKIKHTGLFAGHDYTSKKHTGVRKAVDEFIKEHNLKINLTEDRKDATWFLIADKPFSHL